MSAKENLRILNCTSFLTIFAHAKRDSIFLGALTCYRRPESDDAGGETKKARQIRPHNHIWREMTRLCGSGTRTTSLLFTMFSFRSTMRFFLPSSSSQRRADCGPLGGGFSTCAPLNGTFSTGRCLLSPRQNLAE